MFGKIKIADIKKVIRQLNDPRTLGLVAFGIIALLVTWSGAKAVQTNYDLQKKIARLEQQNQVQELENKNLDLKTQYLQTDEFLDLAARRQFGLAAPGETVVLVPKNVALAHTVDLSPAKKPTPTPSPPTPGYQKNLESWLDFFLHRQSGTN
jgi:cell division protein FtsB